MELNPTHSTTLAYFAEGRTLEDYRNIEAIDWQDKIFQTGKVQIHDIAIRGCNDETRYSLSGSMYDQDGVILNTGYNRYSGRLSLNQKIGDRIEVGENTAYAGSNRSGQDISSGAGSSSQRSYVLMRTCIYHTVLPAGQDPDEFISNIESGTPRTKY